MRLELPSLLERKSVVDSDPAAFQAVNSPRPDPTPGVDVLIIGSGFAGLCMGIHLRKAGRCSFTVLEEGPDVGGDLAGEHLPGVCL
jgi:4-hydroxyacetophenone monooxygenase